MGSAPLAIGVAAFLLTAFAAEAARASACSPEIGESGFGGITVDTPFDRDAIARAVPGCRVTPTAASSEGGAIDTMVIKNGTQPLAQVFPDWQGAIFSVVVRSAAVRNRLGPSLGTSFGTVYGSGPAPVCVGGVEEAAGRVLCPSVPEARLVYLFDGSWNGPDDELPPPQVLAKWRLVAFLWRSMPFEDPRWVDLAGFDPGEGPSLASRVKAAVDDPAALADLVLYPVKFSAMDRQPAEITDAPHFIREYTRRLTPSFVSAIRDEPSGAIAYDEDGVVLGQGRIRIAPKCTDDSCAEHHIGIVAVSMF